MKITSNSFIVWNRFTVFMIALV